MDIGPDEPVIDVRDPLPDDVAVEVLLDLPAALVLAERLRAEGSGGDTIADGSPASLGGVEGEPPTVSELSEAAVLEDLPAELRSRVMAATAQAQYRVIERWPGEQANEEYAVYALAGDRIVHMVLSLRPDDSVAEATESFLPEQILRVVIAGDHAAIEVKDGGEPRWMPVPLRLAMTLVRPRRPASSA